MGLKTGCDVWEEFAGHLCEHHRRLFMMPWVLKSSSLTVLPEFFSTTFILFESLQSQPSIHPSTFYHCVSWTQGRGPGDSVQVDVWNLCRKTNCKLSSCSVFTHVGNRVLLEKNKQQHLRVGQLDAYFSHTFSLYSKQNKSRSAFFALDVHRAFDQVEWEHMLFSIREFGLGENFSILADSIASLRTKLIHTVVFDRFVLWDMLFAAGNKPQK